MKKITFKVSTKKEGSVVSLIKEVNKISCRIQIDLENGFVAVENVADTMIDSVIELIDQYYTILNVMIDNTSDESTSVEASQSVTVVDEPESEAAVEETAEPENKPTVVGPQSEDDLIIQKVEFENEYVENLINRFMRTAYWAMYRMNVPEKEIGDFIWTSINEISMRYNKKGSIEYSVGDIVDCNYGIHLAGEINGGHVSAIVCNITNGGMAYLVPITKVRENLTSLSYLTFDVPDDVVYNNDYYTGGTALLDKGRYLRAERFHEVIGKATPEFFAKVLDQLSTTFDFTGDIVMNDDDTETDFDNEIVKVAETEDETAVVEADVAVAEETVETISEEDATEGDDTESNSVDADNSDVTTTEPKPKKAAKKVGGEESALLNVIGNSLEKLDSTKTVGEQFETFLTDIGMETTERMVTQSFVIACDIKKINYENVILELHNMFPKVKEDIIKSILKENFKKWLDLHPELVESCPKISLMAVLKVFAKRFA